MDKTVDDYAAEAGIDVTSELWLRRSPKERAAIVWRFAYDELGSL